MRAAVLEKIHSLTKALRKGGGSTCKADPTDPDVFMVFIGHLFLYIVTFSVLSGHYFQR